MKVWIEEDYETQIVIVWKDQNPYGTETEVPEEVLKNYEAAANQWREAQQALLKYVK
jgi:hypothetical protein